MSEPTPARAGKRELTRVALSESAFELAQRFGVDHVTISDITAHAGMTRRTFANHFTCKEDALVDVIRRAVPDAAAAVAQLRQNPSVHDLVTLIVSVALGPDQISIYRAIAELTSSSPELQLWIDSAFRSLLDTAHASLRERLDLPLDALDLALLLAAADGMADVVIDAPTVLAQQRARERLAIRLERSFSSTP